MSTMDTILIFGAGGQLGHCLKAAATTLAPGTLIFLDEIEGDILDPGKLELLFEQHQPGWIINCAAYTAVDKAETDRETAARINTTGVENLARCCGKNNTRFIHISTDFVFAGNEIRLLREEDETLPVNVYGLTKLAGERAIPAHTERYFILRTSWLYSEFGNNFVKTMLRLGAERGSLSVIADQVGTPTYGGDLAECMLRIVESDSSAYGLYHYSNEGTASWFDFAKAVFDLSGTPVELTPIPAAGYPTPARRPAFSVLDKTRVKTTFGIQIPYWRHSLERCIDKLRSPTPAGIR